MKIYTICFNRPEFIELQLKSAIKFVEDFEELIVLNNAVDNLENYKKINETCQALNIKCYQIPFKYAEYYKVSNSHSAAFSMNYLFEEVLQDHENCCIIHSDMFFIKRVNLQELLSDNDIIYYPQYRQNFGIHYCYDGFCILNLVKNKSLKTMKWNNGVLISNTELTDAGGATHFFFEQNKSLKKNFVEEYSIYNSSINECDLIINGNINYKINFENNTIQHTGGNKYKNKSFPYEDSDDNYYSNLILKCKKLLDKILPYNFPNPIHFGLLKNMMEDDYFMAHYKTGSNYLNFCNTDYNAKKFHSLKNFL